MSTGSITSGTGLVSGIDYDSLIDQLVALEENRVTEVEEQEQEVEEEQSAMSSLETYVEAFGDAAETLSDEDAFEEYTSTSSDDDIATVTGTEGAASGTYSLVVQQLATNEKVASTSFSSSATALGLSGSFTISCSDSAIEDDPTTTSVSVTIDSTDSLQEIATKINSADGTGVTASILTQGSSYYLVLTAVDSGTEGFYLTDVSGDVLSDGLEILTDTQQIQSDFCFMEEEGGAATEETTFADLFTQVGGNRLTDGDTITISGTNADGDTISTTFTITDTDTTTLGDLLDAVKEAYGDNVDVSLNSSGEIVISNTGSGTETMTMTMSYSGQSSKSTMSLGSSSQQNVYENVINEATNAFYTMDGLAISATSNTDDETIDGIEFTLKQVSTDTVTLTVDMDYDAIIQKIQSFVDAYNDLMDFIDDQTSVTVTESSDDDEDSVEAGALANNSTVDTIKSALQRIMTSNITLLDDKTEYTSLSLIGITTDYETGELEVDEDDLQDALESDLEGVMDLFGVSGYSSNGEWSLGYYTDDTESGVYSVDASTGEIDTDSSATSSSMSTAKRTGSSILTSKSGDSSGLTIDLGGATSDSGTFTFVRGIASQIEAYVADATDSVDGIFKIADDAYDKKIDKYEDRIATLEDQVDAYYNRLVTQFAALEQTMASLNAQSTAFSSAASSL